MEPVDYASWYPKKVVAGMCGVSTKTIETYIKQGKLHGEHWKRPSDRITITVCDPDDVQTLLQEMGKQSDGFPNPKQAERPTTVMESALSHSFPDPIPVSVLRLIEASIEKVSKVLKPNEKIFLTLSEASEYSGIPEDDLRLFISGQLKVRLTSDGPRIKRTDLEAL